MVAVKNLIKPLSDKSIAGSYGRQVPTENSNPLDVRDLVMLFRNESFIQSKDSFFHNANSAFLKSTWEEYPFSEIATNIEDRIWGDQVISKGKNCLCCRCKCISLAWSQPFF